ncbi:2TM domain-containing protein [Flavobacterium oreochromis]|uniref:2TM domain-containing protein n=2 Tax=Flavobacterium TaxID=237 RepID=A0A246GBY6_9FLAO|nr:2TM domain-containing protein [Flavobacterium oreochromis]OWP74339.1 hypothetical protein BWG23_14200 [Flavobacterium oreochromis]OWP78287.1 hypothetical protein BWK62_05640 [Flavobacterium oreochromis]POR30566.1 hypothetical protein BWK58_01580 [Flavobacterium columnare]QYS86837.1 2TM domain-containing protein [Flavobacterium oreochromis]
MDINQQELYEYARLRIKQKRRLYFHFVIWFTASLFLLFANYILNTFPSFNWSIWVISIWALFFILHFIRVFITERFMNKKWEREQIEKLVFKQQRKLEQLQKDIQKNA